MKVHFTFNVENQLNLVHRMKFEKGKRERRKKIRVLSAEREALHKQWRLYSYSEWLRTSFHYCMTTKEYMK